MIRKKGPLVYIVDSNSVYRETIKDHLKIAGIKRTMDFDCGEQCFTGNVPVPDMFILDYNLGNENWNGIEFMQEYSRSNVNVTYLFLSSSTNNDIAIETIKKGAIDYIRKSKPGLSRMLEQVKKFKNSLGE